MPEKSHQLPPLKTHDQLPPDVGNDWISQTRWKLGVASRRTGLTKEQYWLKYRDEIIRHNRYP